MGRGNSREPITESEKDNWDAKQVCLCGQVTSIRSVASIKGSPYCSCEIDSERHNREILHMRRSSYSLSRKRNRLWDSGKLWMTWDTHCKGRWLRFLCYLYYPHKDGGNWTNTGLHTFSTDILVLLDSLVSAWITTGWMQMTLSSWYTFFAKYVRFVYFNIFD
jgi:hypothetical protein